MLSYDVMIQAALSLLMMVAFYALFHSQKKQQQHAIMQLNNEMHHTLQQHLITLLEKIQNSEQKIHPLITQTIHEHMRDMRSQIDQSFKQHANAMNTQLQYLTQHMNEQLNQGFEKTTSTFTDIVRRLTIIDEAQKKITELSSHVVSLQDVLMDKRARGAFGEIQLEHLIKNMMPESHYQMQYTLPNQKRADCALFLPDPTGMIIIDSKFPLETYQKLANTTLEAQDKKSLQQQFRADLQKHIKDIAEKYILANVTSDGAIMFIPAESIFAEIHAHYPEIVSFSQRMHVWLVSPSTLMAVLTTARAVLKDDATKKQVHIIQQHLRALAVDFQRFEKRMDNLSKHIEKAQQDVSEVNTSARKISNQFKKIESVELDHSTDIKQLTE